MAGLVVPGIVTALIQQPAGAGMEPAWGPRPARSPDPDARSSGSSHSPSPAAVPKTSWNSSRLRTMLARNSGGLCGSMVRYCCSCSLRRLVRQQWPSSGTALRAVLDRGLAALADDVRLVADRQAAEVADVLADGEAAVDVLAGQVARLEGVVLLDQGLATSPRTPPCRRRSTSR